MKTLEEIVDRLGRAKEAREAADLEWEAAREDFIKRQQSKEWAPGGVYQARLVRTEAKRFDQAKAKRLLGALADQAVSVKPMVLVKVERKSAKG